MSASTPKRRLDPNPDQPAAKKPKPDDSPNAFIYCHQCNKKRDATLVLRCTAKNPKGRRCNAKYCKPCLKNRYGLLLEDILARGEKDHAHGEGYHFTCPRCDGVCNCVACRKAKGLRPTGNLANVARQSGLSSAADVLNRDPKAAGPMAHKPGENKTNGTASKHDTKSLSAPIKRAPKQTALSVTASKVKPAPKPKVTSLPRPKLLAKPVWTCVGTALSLTEAEQRINIREFVLRFSSVLQLSRVNLDELDEIRPSRTRNNLEDEDEDLVPWVSEACARSLLVGLLNMLDAKGDSEKHLNAAIKSLRESGAHLNKMWSALATLRDRLENRSTSSRAPPTGPLLYFPDPLPPPESVSIIQTRSGANHSNTGNVNVLRTAQLVPVISALIKTVVESEVVRQELEAGAQESKERTKEARDAHRIENERFEQEKEREKTTGKRLDKSRMEHHKRIIASIDDALKVASYTYIPRISPLGRDIEGRIYWALTPGMNEREDALNLLYSCSHGRAHKSRSRRKPLVPSEEDRSTFRKWSWFVAVWGKRPPITERTVVEDSDDSEEEEDSDDDDKEEEEEWWGFWEPEEIMKLASWVHFKAGLEDISEHKSQQNGSDSSRSRMQPHDSDVDMDDLFDDENSEQEDDDMRTNTLPTKGEVTTLVKELEQYASLLKARAKKDEETEDDRLARG